MQVTTPPDRGKWNFPRKTGDLVVPRYSVRAYDWPKNTYGNFIPGIITRVVTEKYEYEVFVGLKTMHVLGIDLIGYG